MAWFGRRRRPGVSQAEQDRYREDMDHLERFTGSRYGVEAYLEPRTTVTQTTVILIAHDGEWTRRRVADPSAARQFAQRMAIPLYDVRLVGYPKRMREYNQRRKRAAGT